jgi:hypothetical protein
VSFKAAGFSSAMSNPYLLNRRKFSGTGTGAIDDAIANNSVTGFYAHDTGEMSETELRDVCNYLDTISESIDIVTPRDILPDYAIGTL